MSTGQKSVMIVYDCSLSNITYCCVKNVKSNFIEVPPEQMYKQSWSRIWCKYKVSETLSCCFMFDKDFRQSASFWPDYKITSVEMLLKWGHLCVSLWLSSRAASHTDQYNLPQCSLHSLSTCSSFITQTQDLHWPQNKMNKSANQFQRDSNGSS